MHAAKEGEGRNKQGGRGKEISDQDLLDILVCIHKYTQM